MNLPMSTNYLFLKESIWTLWRSYRHIGFSKTQNRKCLIGTAIALIFAYLVQDRFLKPPRKIRHIPFVGWIPVLLSSIRRESAYVYGQKNIHPKLKSKEIKDIYVRSSDLGWIIYFLNPKDIKQILLKPDLFPKINLSEGYENTLTNRFSDGHSLFFSNGPEWKAVKSVISPVFSRSLPVEMFGERASRLFERMESIGNVIEVSNLMRRYTLDVIGQAAFDIDFEAIADPNCEWVALYDIINKGIQDPFFFTFPNLEQDHLWMFDNRIALHRCLDKLMGKIDKAIEQRKEELRNANIESSARNDMLTTMIKALEKKNGIVREEQIKSNFCFFFLAGHDSTTNAICFALYYFAAYPETQQRAREEVNRVLGTEPKDVLPDMNQIKQMEYIYMVIKEVLRIHPPAPRSGPRRAKEDTVISGTFIPKDSIVAIDIYNAHHHQDVWENENVFDPERFRKTNYDGRHAGKGISWLPFGSGPRQCVGMNFSLTEQRVVLCMMLRKFNWSLPENSPHNHGVLTSGSFLAGPENMEIKFESRY
ncbi:cytochrome P450 [Choanephora cucurbitarum]|nr:cytochrome P450 [Choanephora cucurbitarum]